MALYYVSNSSGGTNSGTLANPWTSLSSINWSIINPGDQINLKKGDVFYETLTIGKSGSVGSPITISAYGTGAKPIISGFVTVSSWTSDGGGVYESTLGSGLSTLNMVTINGVFQAIGRYPKVTAANKGYITYTSHSGTSSVTGSISGLPSFVGGECVIRANHWILDRYIISGQSSTTVTFSSYITPPTGYSGYALNNGFGFFFQNHVNTLSSLGDWCYTGSSKKLQMYFGANSPASYTIQASVRDNVLVITGRNYVSFSGISFQGSNSHLFNINVGSNIQFANCDLQFAGIDAVYMANSLSSYISFTGCTLTDINNNGCTVNDSTNISFTSNNILNNIGMIAGMGQGSDGQYMGMANIGNNSTITNNNITNIGYTAIYLKGIGITVQYNYVDGFCSVKDDGGGIYCYGKTFGSTLIDHNIVLNGLGATAGTTGGAYAEGIYMDDETNSVSITNNSVAYCADRGVYIHNAHEITITGNTVFDCTSQQINMTKDNIAVDNIRNISMSGNIYVAKTSGEKVFYYNTVNSENINTFGTFDSNYYCRPIAETTPLAVTDSTLDAFINLSTWQSHSGEDAHSHTSPLTITDVSKLRFEYNNTNVDKNVSLGGSSYIDMTGAAYSGTVTLPAFTSLVLIQTGAAPSISPRSQVLFIG